MPPAGYERLLVGHAVAVARYDLAASVRSALVQADGSRGTLHEFASRQPKARAFRGRGVAWAVTLPGSALPVVVRHNQRGGVLRAIGRDRFLAPTRAPRELEVSTALLGAGIRTPEVLAYALYPPGGLVQRSDVVTREIGASRDLAAILVDDDDDARARALAGAAELVASLSRHGARHPDLNAKNILIAPEGPYVLDVDRVHLATQPIEALHGNLARLARSLRKWRDRFGAHITDAQISELEDAARRSAAL